MASEVEQQPARYVVGIDLGTTNSAVAYVDTHAEPWRVSTFQVPQLVAPGVVEPRDTLPSCHYQRAEGEFAAGALRLPWSNDDPEFAVGFLARDQGTMAPGRLVASAKSWLCHAGVDRLADLLPWHAAADVARISPVEASARYLRHIRAAWNFAHPREPLEQQDVVLTLPASFDEVARELTVRAAALAELPRIVLIEEPQAAFYAWIYAQNDEWDRAVQPGDKILVADVGGGTSDFTLIHARQDSGGRVQFQRVAVGEHLILGGDNLDLALAKFVEGRLAERGVALEPRQWSTLVRVCRPVKEQLLGSSPPERLTVNLPGSGSRLIGGGLQVEVTREEVQQMLVEGFLPRVSLDSRPAARRSGFHEFGLPYAPDAAITRYLAGFLTAHRHVVAEATSHQASSSSSASLSDPARPDVLLFNGGVFDSPLLRDRVLQVVRDWFAGGTDWSPRLLANARLDLAVAQGAAYYGMVRRGAGVKIAAGLARTYYVGVESRGPEPVAAVPDADPEAAESTVAAPPALSAVCLAPAGVEEGQTIDLAERRFELRVREPVEFPLYVSSTRLTDRAGELVAVDPEQLTALPPIRTVLQSGKKSGEALTLAVQLHARLTEIGTLDLWCSAVDGPQTWRLQFDVRAATRTDLAGHQGLAERQGVADESTRGVARKIICATFDPETTPSPAPEGLVKRLAAALDTPRQMWPPSLLRDMWEALLELEAGRKRSPVHEARWLNLLGFSLRPGYGLAVDDWRVAQTWRTLQGRLWHAQPMCRVEWWILWRRIAGGMLAGQQRSLADPLIADVRTAQRTLAKGRGTDFKAVAHETAEIWRLLGAFELLPVAEKIELGSALLDLAGREKTPALAAAGVWSIGRLGARVPLYGPLNTVVPSESAASWLTRLLEFKRPPETLPLALMQLARRTGDRYRDIGEPLRAKVLRRLADDDSAEHFRELVEQGGELEEDEQAVVFGDSLPRGLRIA